MLSSRQSFLRAIKRSRRALDATNLGYYGVARCLTVLVRGFLGAKIYQHPLVIRDLVANIRETAGIEIAVPAPH